MSLPYFSVVDHMPMLDFMNKILSCFESCFSRKAAFRWFVIITVGLMLRSDKLGVTSVIRDLALKPDCYLSMLHFFRASSWSLEGIRQCWFQTVSRFLPLCQEDGFHILVGDGVKQSKEGRRIPGVKKLCQESENSAKPQFIHGHMFGGLGILAGSIHSLTCIPLSIRLHDGLQELRNWDSPCISNASHVIQMIEDAYEAAKVFGDSLLLLDRYFLSVPALTRLRELTKEGSIHMEIVTKAKRNCIAYEKPSARKPGRGRPAKKGNAVHLKEVFHSHKEKFLQTELELYGKKEKIRYYSIDLLWGQKLYQELRFVLVEYNGVQSILAGTSLSIEPLSMIRLYSYRFRIECTFRELKQQLGGFCYHFWSKHMPKIDYYRKKTEPTPLEQVTDNYSRKKIMEAIRAIEMHMALSCIAMGTIQALAIQAEGKLRSEQIRYQRTPSKGKISEGAMMCYLRKYIFHFMGQSPELRITQLIQEMQEMSVIDKDLLAS